LICWLRGATAGNEDDLRQGARAINGFHFDRLKKLKLCLVWRQTYDFHFQMKSYEGGREAGGRIFLFAFFGIHLNDFQDANHTS